MERRNFLKRTVAAGTVALTTGLPVSNFAKQADTPLFTGLAQPAKHTFKLKYAPHFGMFKSNAGDDPIKQLQFMASMGFMALEDNGMMGRPKEQQEKIGQELARLGMTMGVFVIDGGDNWKPSLTTGKPEFLENFLKTCRTAVEVAKRCNAKWMTVVPGFFKRDLAMGYQTAHVIEALRRGAEILEPHGLIMVLEPLSDTPDLFLRHSDQTYMICKAVKSLSCKILFDIYHMQRNEGQLISNIDAAWDEIAYIQIGDNPGRNEPTTGEINYKRIFEHVYNKGYRGVMGMEHGNAKPGKEGEMALIDAYVSVDNFKV